MDDRGDRLGQMHRGGSFGCRCAPPAARRVEVGVPGGGPGSFAPAPMPVKLAVAGSPANCGRMMPRLSRPDRPPPGSASAGAVRPAEPAVASAGQDLRLAGRVVASAAAGRSPPAGACAAMAAKMASIARIVCPWFSCIRMIAPGRRPAMTVAFDLCVAGAQRVCAVDVPEHLQQSVGARRSSRPSRCGRRREGGTGTPARPRTVPGPAWCRTYLRRRQARGQARQQRVGERVVADRSQRALRRA